MKRIICILTALCLVLGSFSFAFAVDWSTTDSNNLATIKNSVISGGQLYNVVNACNTALNNINYNLVTLMGWLDPANGGSTTALLNQILNALVFTDAGNAVKSWLAELYTNTAVLPLSLPNIEKSLIRQSSWSSALRYSNAHYNLVGNDGTYTVRYINGSGNPETTSIQWSNGTPLGNIAYLIQRLTLAYCNGFTYEKNYLIGDYGATQTSLSWTDITQTSSFTPTSTTNGIYTWLSKIQAPVARLSYVLASDERIEAQEAASANEQAVVDNFIDSTGAGSASTSDIGFISDLSSGYKNNFGSSASVTGIFNIFDSNNFGWFSQETANQLDTSSNYSRAKSGSEFETPLLDQRINDIYDALGVKP